MQLMKCPSCDSEIKKGDRFCPECGEKLNLCKKCGHRLEGDEKFCLQCGTKIKVEKETKEAKKVEKEEEEQEEETFECEFCGKEFPSEVKCLRHEKTCPEREADVEDDDEEEEPKKVEVKEVHHYHQPQSSGGGGFLKFIGYLFLIIIIVGAIIIAAALFGEISSKGGIEQAIDPCLRARDNCYSSCGEGVLSTITFCKDRCDNTYRTCKGG